MEKAVIFAVLVILIALGAYLLGSGITGMFIGFGQPTDAEWWNVSWHYRIRLDINSTQYSRSEWPVEYEINFTDMLPAGTFDINSTRIIEYSPSGEVLYEAPSQFDQDDNFDASSNALGTMVFMLNGTTAADSNRTFYVYYDIIENGAKEFKTYPTNLTFDKNGNLITMNNTFLRFFIDTNRGENTSGIYWSENYGGTVIVIAGDGSRTAEYMEYSNGTHDMAFDMIGNGTFTNGSIRIGLKQLGNEIVFGNPSQTTGEASAAKRYYVYNNAGPQQYGTFIKVVQRISNDAGYQIQRNSTLSGALALDLGRTLNSGSISAHDNSTANPFSWAWARGASGECVGIVNLNQTGTTDYYVNDDSLASGRIGVQLNSTAINSGSYIEQVSLIYFAGNGGGLATSEFLDIKNRFVTPIHISQTLPEVWYVTNQPSTNVSVFNRNETALIIGSITTGDPYNLTEYMNATLDMGTAGTGDDQTIVLYDDGSHEDGSADDKVFANTFEIPNDANASIWTINFTMYGNESLFLNWTTYEFNVTDVFNVNVTVINKNPVESDVVLASILVRNYNLTENVAGAIINCSYNYVEVVNKTDHGNGTYSVNFTAPSVGDHVLYCNASKNGNFGNNSDAFTSETSKTSMSIMSYPSQTSVTNITLYDNRSFSVTTNATNIGNGTAYSSNISLHLLAGWDADFLLQECGNVLKTENCTKSFNITVPNGTYPGNYYINVSANWTNPDNTAGSNTTIINVTVEQNPQISVLEGNITSEVADANENYIGNFTVLSIGNDALQNITFNCSSGTVCNDFTVTFSPASISSLSVDTNYSVAVNVTVPFDYAAGTYNGTVNVSAENDYYATILLLMSVPQKTNVSITTSPTNQSISNITKANNQSFSFESTAQNIGNGSAKYVNISLNIPAGWYPNSSLEYCNNLTKGQSCTKGFNVTVPNGTYPGNYYINVSANWTNPDNTIGGNVTALNVTVLSSALINVSELSISGNLSDGIGSRIGNFTVLSIGNDALQNITFNCSSGTVCNDFTVTFSPASISSLSVDTNYSVAVNVTAPLGYTVGTYNGTINVSAGNDHYDTFDVFTNILSNRSWTMSPTLCEKNEEPEAGTACEIQVRNVGNDVINFTISPEYGNYTQVNVTSFTVSNGLNYTFRVDYNISNVSRAVYNSTFLIDAIQTNTTPDNMTFNVNLVPNVPPIIAHNVTPNFTEQNSSVMFYVNLTDRSGSDIKWVNVSVTSPDSSVNSSSMTLISKSGNFSRWYLNYSSIGNTSLRGMYNASISVMDNVGNLGNASTNFTVYKKMLVTATTLSSVYYQGDTGSIYFAMKNASGAGVNNSNVTFIIKDGNDNITHYTQQQTNEDGTIFPVPSFTLYSDAPIGTYTLFTNYSFYDEILNQTLEFQRNSTFDVQSRTITVTGLFGDVETSVVWYPNNIMKFGILVYNGEGRPVDPDDIDLTIYDPADNVYFTTSMSSMTKEATGYYTYNYAMGASTASGMYLAVLNITQGSFQAMKLKAFRVSQGGPYDVRLRLFENEVNQGSYLDFEIVIENKGEVTQDVYIEYNVSNPTGNYYFASEAVLTPAFSNNSFTRSAYIYSDQISGTYTLNAKVQYSTVQPPINANVTFAVVSGGAPAPSPPSEGDRPTYYVIKPTTETQADILITEYNSNMSLARGKTKIEKVVVRNTGRTNLNNVSLFLLGIPSNWFNITPSGYSKVVPDNTSVFIIEFNVPENANEGKYDASLLAASGVVSDQKNIEINVFKFFKTLLEDELRKIELDFINLKVDIKIAENEGKDVSSLMEFVDLIETYILEAKENIYNNELDEAMEKITTIISLLKRARDLLDILEVTGPDPFIFMLIISISLVIVIVIAFLLIYFWRKKELKKVLRPFTSPIVKVMDKLRRGEADKEKLEIEKDKLFRMLRVLETEKNEGTVTMKSYTKMRKNLESKINEINKKLKYAK